MRREYQLDYRKSRPNRFAPLLKGGTVRSCSTRTLPRCFGLPSPSIPSFGPWSTHSPSRPRL